MKKHEICHCNGWPGDHRGGRPVPSVSGDDRMKALQKVMKEIFAWCQNDRDSCDAMALKLGCDQELEGNEKTCIALKLRRDGSNN